MSKQEVIKFFKPTPLILLLVATFVSIAVWSQLSSGTDDQDNRERNLLV
ncbi:MAG: hypothetical protein MN733_40600 [Nitrososphaera sp.]|nr:hypothetical protein [Nitrososphaera sp.]